MSNPTVNRSSTSHTHSLPPLTRPRVFPTSHRQSLAHRVVIAGWCFFSAETVLDEINDSLHFSCRLEAICAVPGLAGIFLRCRRSLYVRLCGPARQAGTH